MSFNSPLPQPRSLRRLALSLLLAVLGALAGLIPAWAAPSATPSGPAPASAPSGAVSGPAAEAQPPKGGVDLSVFRSIPIQNQGRLKPLDTFAREAVFQITGKERLDGVAPLDRVLGWMVDGTAAAKAPLIDVSHHTVHDPMGLAKDVRRISLSDAIASTKLRDMAQEASRKQAASEALTATDKQVLRVLGRIELLNGICRGESLTVVPAADPKLAWKGLDSIIDPTAGVAVGAQLPADLRSLLLAYKDGRSADFLKASTDLKAHLAALAPAAVPSDAVMARELQYNDLHPFGRAWIIYLSAFLVLLASGALRKGDDTRGPLYWPAIAMVVGGVILHGYGFALRCLISGRAPVTNMYESVIWVSLGAMVLSLLIELSYGTRSVLMAASVAATVCLILADNTSSVLDPAINPLTPVLRSNFWLTIHVLTITLSYAAFLVAMGEGHVALWTYAFHPERRPVLRSLHQQLYRAIQVGVVLLAAGTILGGVWANYSWGRFWGWDPKEVWALIALLGYLALLHGRYAGWLHDYGLAAGSIVAFLGVLMAWYGVNFVLGAGLHAYGFGEGGQQYVAAGVAVDLGYVALMSYLHKVRRIASV